MKFQTLPRSRGFTLVELLVVIVIIAALAALSFTVGPKMLKKSRATKSMQNVRDIAPVIAGYAADNSMKLPPIIGETTLPDGTRTDRQWTEAVLAQMYPNVELETFREKQWWDQTKPPLSNPLLEPSAQPRGWKPQNPGYAFNEMIAENTSTDGAATGDVLEISVPMAAISDPARTPMIAPWDNFHYRFDPQELSRFNSGTPKELLVEGKMPVLFVDGHVEVISPADYNERQLYLNPR